MRWRLRTALTLNFVLLASLPILVVGFFSTAYLATIMEREYAEKHILLANSYANALDRFLIGSSFNLAHLVNLLDKGDILLTEHLNSYLQSLIDNDIHLEMVRILDDSGVITNLAPFDQNIFGLDMSRQSYSVAAKEGNIAYWSSIFISPQTGASTLVLAIPFNRGIVVGHISLSAVHEIINSMNMGPGGYAAVVDNNGTVIGHRNRKLVEQQSHLSGYYHIEQGLAGHEGTYQYDEDGVRHISSVSFVRETGWVVAISQPLKEVFAPIRYLKNMLYGGTGIAIIVAVSAAILSLQRMLSPLREITQNAKSIADGNYTLKPVTAVYDEINDLSESFKIMIEQVRSREVFLRESEERFRSTFEQAAVGMAYISPEGRFLRINQKICEMIGYSIEEMMAKSFQDITHPDDLGIDLLAFQQVLEGERTDYTLDKRYIHQDGSILWINLTIGLLRDEAGKPRYFVSVVKDISLRKEAELKLITYQHRLKALQSQLFIAEDVERARIAAELHDSIGQTLALCRIQLARSKKLSESEKLTEILDEISGSMIEVIEQTQGLVFDLRSPLLHELGLHVALADWLERELKKKYSINFDFHRDDTLPVITGDVASVLFRSFKELMTNIIKHSQAANVSVCLERKDEDLLLVVEDDGIGFDPEKVENTVMKNGGFGLFSIVERISDIGGSFRIISAEGQGCKAILKVPIG